MGGKNAVIVDESADLDEAVLGVRQSAFGYGGQKCSACSRVIVMMESETTRIPKRSRSTPDAFITLTTVVCRFSTPPPTHDPGRRTVGMPVSG